MAYDLWHQTDMLTALLNVRSRGQAETMLALGFSAFYLGCVKSRVSQGSAELFSQLPSPDRGCQRNWFPYR